jgi:hypothetical protein
MLQVGARGVDRQTDTQYDSFDQPCLYIAKITWILLSSLWPKYTRNESNDRLGGLKPSAAHYTIRVIDEKGISSARYLSKPPQLIDLIISQHISFTHQSN